MDDWGRIILNLRLCGIPYIYGWLKQAKEALLPPSPPYRYKGPPKCPGGGTLKITSECVPCLIKRSVYETRLVGGDEGKAISAALGALSRHYSPDKCSAAVATLMHRAVYDTLGSEDPYRELKDKANTVARSLLPRARELMEGSKDRLKAAVTCAIMGNVMDFGIEGSFEGPEALGAEFERLFREGMGHDDVDRARGWLRPGARVVYFFDNCGELYFDTLLLGELRSMGVSVTAVAKGAPILTDVTREDARAAGIEDLVDRLVDTGVFAVGMDLDCMPPELSGALDGADLIVSKGMANYEAMSERDMGPVLHLMRTKCGSVSHSLGLPRNLSVAVLVGARNNGSIDPGK